MEAGEGLRLGPQDAALEVLALAAAGRLLPARAPAALRALLSGEASPEAVQAGAADAAWLLWLDVGEAGAVPSGEEGGAGAWRGRLVEAARALLAAGLLSERKLLEAGEPDFLAAVGVIACSAAFQKKVLKTNTRMLYVQEKYNLLCEEPEGFAKVVVALYQFAAHFEGEGEDGSGGGNVTALEILKRHVEALIGQFLLDPNRVLDLLLEVLEDFPHCGPLVALAAGFKSQAARFFIGFKANHFHTAGRVAVAAGDEGAGPGAVVEAADGAGDGDADATEAGTGAGAGAEAGPPGGGATFRHVVPMALYDAAGALVKAGLASQAEVQELLQPGVEGVLEIAATGLEEQQRRVRKIGAVSLAGLGGGRAGGPSAKEPEMPNLRLKAGLSAAGLEMEGGAYNAVFGPEEVGRVGQVSNQHFGLCCGALNVQDWPTALSLLEDFREKYHVAPAADPGVARALCSAVGKLLQPVYAAYCPGSGLGRPKTAAPDDEFQSQIPPEALELLEHLRLHLYRDPELMTKLCRILRHEVLGSGERGAAKSVAEGLLRRVLLPGLSLVPANPALSHEVWSVLELLPYTDRFRVYSETAKDAEDEPILLAACKLATVGVRKIMRRVTKPSGDKQEKEAMKRMGRMLAKLGHGSPLAAMRTIVQQVEAYEAMTGPVVDALRFFSPLGFDVLTYTIVMRFVTGGREKLKEDGVSISDWFQNLASFTGQLCKKYPGLELTALCQYVANQLKDGETIDLLVLKELVAKMTMIETLEDLSDSQIESLAGGETLRLEALLSQLHRTNPKPVQKCVRRLRGALFTGGRNQQLAVPLLVLIAQQKQASIFTAETRHLKLLGELVDRCNEIFIQYSALLWAALQPSSHYIQVLPPMEKLHSEFGLPPETVFHLYRPLLSANVVAGCAAAAGDGDGGGGAAEKGTPTEGPTSLEKKMAWEELLQASRAVVPPAVASGWPELYLTFWSLSLYDVHFPEERYAHEVDSLRAQSAKLQKASENHRISGEESSQLLRERDKHRGVMEAIIREKSAQAGHVCAVREALGRSKDAWLAKCSAGSPVAMEQFLQYCIFPRVVLSPGEALYCAKFVEVVHELGTPGFDTLAYLRQVVTLLSQMVFCCTQNEAARLGIFLKETLRMLNSWGSSEAHLPHVPHDDLAAVTRALNEQLVEALTASLRSAEYMEVRNALRVLTKIVKQFPSTLDPVERSLELASRVQDCAAKVRDEDPREDLKTLARCYLGMLHGKVQELRKLLPAPPLPESAGAVEREGGGDVAGERCKGEQGEIRPEEGELPPGAGDGGRRGPASEREKKLQKKSPRDKKRKEESDKCRQCGRTGHYARDCPDAERPRGGGTSGGARNGRGVGSQKPSGAEHQHGGPRGDRRESGGRGAPLKGGGSGGGGGGREGAPKRRREEDRPPPRGEGRGAPGRGNQQHGGEHGGGGGGSGPPRHHGPREGGRPDFERERGRQGKRPREEPYGDDWRGGHRDQRRRPWK